MPSTPLTRTAAALAGATLALVLSGCSFWAPQTVETPYPAGDGVSGEIGGREQNGNLKLRNFLVVSSAKGAPGVLVGAVVNDGPEEQQVELTVTAAAPAGEAAARPLVSRQFTVPPGGFVKVGAGSGPRLQIPAVPQPPGGLLVLRAGTPDGGGEELDVPVLAPRDQYASLTPTVGASAAGPLPGGGTGTSSGTPSDPATGPSASAPSPSTSSNTPSESPTGTGAPTGSPSP